mgnify:CR=1 FL=1
MTEKEYQEAYEKEKQKSADLAARIAQLEDQKKDLELRLGHIQNNPLWKWSKPARKAMHFCIRQKDRIANCGGPKGVLHKIHYKIRAKKAMEQFGTASFPTAQEREKQSKECFPRMPKISILVPLWNTPEAFSALYNSEQVITMDELPKLHQ